MMSQTKPHAIEKIARDERGNVATLTAFAIVPLIILLAGVLNLGMAWTMRNDLQYTADAAALAGASQLGNDANVRAKANEFAAQNMAPSGHGDVLADVDIEIGHWDSATRVFTVGAPKDAVRITTRRTEATGNSVPVFLGNYIGRDHWDLTTTAIAAKRTDGEGCILALHPTGGAFTMTGNASLTLNGCGAMSNSTSSNSFSIGGSADATMTCALAAGGITVQKVNGLTLTQCPSPQPNVSPVPDPFDSVPEPPVTGPCKSFPSGQGAATIQSGRYCNPGSLKGTKTFATGGIFVIDGGTMQVSAQANITGTDVTFFFTNNAKVDMNANGNVNLSAKTSGPYQGLLFWGDDSNSNNTNLFNGGPTSRLTGAIYFPKQAVDYRGNFTGVNGCMRIVADTIDFRGNTGMAITCPNLPGIPFTQKLSLVD